MIPPVFSWGQLQITSDIFQDLLARQQVFTAFLRTVGEFGAKAREGPPKCSPFSGTHGYVKASVGAPHLPSLNHGNEIMNHALFGLLADSRIRSVVYSLSRRAKWPQPWRTLVVAAIRGLPSGERADTEFRLDLPQSFYLCPTAARKFFGKGNNR